MRATLYINHAVTLILAATLFMVPLGYPQALVASAMLLSFVASARLYVYLRDRNQLRPMATKKKGWK